MLNTSSLLRCQCTGTSHIYYTYLQQARAMACSGRFLSVLLLLLLLLSVTTTTTSVAASAPPAAAPAPGLGLAVRLANGEGSQQQCWEVLMEIKSCTGEIILFFINGEAYLGPGCCRAIRVIQQSRWATDAMLSVLGFTPQEGDILKGYCDAGDGDNNAGGQQHKPSPPHATPALDCVAACERAAPAVPGGRKSLPLLHH